MTPAHPGCTAAALRLVPGAVYRFGGIGAGPGVPLANGRWKYRPALYRLVGLSTSTRMLAGGPACGGRQEVVYEGIAGPEAGLLCHCPLEDFGRNFTLVVEQPPPEKVLDCRTTGSGV